MFTTIREEYIEPALNRDSVRVTHESEHTVVTFEVPGFTKDEISLTELDGVVKVRARHNSTDGAQHSSKERSYTYNTGQDKLDKVEATLKNGMLEVRFLKSSNKKDEAKNIPIVD